VATLLRIDSSASGDASATRALTARFADGWRTQGPGFDVIERDLHADPPPHLPDASLHRPPAERAPEPFPAAAALQAAFVDELRRADAIVIGSPLYNYSVPSPLKAWLDYVHVPGWIGPSADPPKPLAGTPVVVLTSRGGTYDPGTPTEHWDHGSPLIEVVLGGMLGMTVTIVAADAAIALTSPKSAHLAPRRAAEVAAAERRVDELVLRCAGVAAR